MSYVIIRFLLQYKNSNKWFIDWTKTSGLVSHGRVLTTVFLLHPDILAAAMAANFRIGTDKKMGQKPDKKDSSNAEDKLPYITT